MNDAAAGCPTAQQPARKHCEHCSGVIGEDDEFVITADDYWLHRKCAVERPAHPQPCPDGEACPDARRWGSVHQQPAPADVPPMPKPGEMWGHERILALHAACVRIAQERDEARCEVAELQADRRRVWEVGERWLKRALEAEAELAALKGQKPLFWVEDTTEDDEHNPFDRYRIAFDGSQCPTAFAVYAAPLSPPDSVPREQHEAALVQARREERKSIARALRSSGRSASEAFVRALAEGEEVGK